MNKKTIIIVAVVAIIAVVLGIISGYNSAAKQDATKQDATKQDASKASNLSISSADDLTILVDKIYEGVSIEMPMLMTMPVDTTDVDAVKSFTGLDSAENIEYAVVSEPMMSSQAYSMVLVKVKDGADADAIAKAMNENIDERKWICVTAEKIYTTTSGNVICLVMTNAETAQPVFESFKTNAGSVGKVYERTAEVPEMPEDMLPGQDGLAY